MHRQLIHKNLFLSQTVNSGWQEKKSAGKQSRVKIKKIKVGYMLFIMIYPMIRIGFEYK